MDAVGWRLFHVQWLLPIVEFIPYSGGRTNGFGILRNLGVPWNYRIFMGREALRNVSYFIT